MVSYVFWKILSLVVLICVLNIVKAAFWDTTKSHEKKEIWSDYGVDVSTAIHYPLDKSTYWGREYERKMAGCYKNFGKNACVAGDLARMEMNLNQPRTQHNYTDIGFKKIKAPKELMDVILEFYNAHKDSEVPEKWPAASIYVNHWDSPTYMISFENTQFRGGFGVKQRIWDLAKPILEEWTNKKVIPTSLYGIRVYKDNAVLATHVDRLPLVSSAIIQVAQDVDEPWPIEVYARDGKAYNVSMEPGDMVLYESHTTLHGRPFPMKGRYYANVFVHFSPIDHDEQNENDPKLIELRKLAGEVFESEAVVSAKKNLKKTLDSARIPRGVGGHEHENHPKSAEERHLEDLAKQEKELRSLHESNPEEYKAIMDEEEKKNKLDENAANGAKGRTDLHIAAALGFIENVRKILGGHRTDIINSRDENGWQAIHEASRSGHLDVLQYLVDLGADVNAVTLSGQTPLSLARSRGGNDEVIEYLENMNAEEGEPLEDEEDEEEEN